MEDCGYPDGYFDFVWCRDVLEQVEPLLPALQAASRVLNPNGRMLVYTTVATDPLEPGETAMLRRHLGDVESNLVESDIDAHLSTPSEFLVGSPVIVAQAIEFVLIGHVREHTPTINKALA